MLINKLKLNFFVFIDFQSDFHSYACKMFYFNCSDRDLDPDFVMQYQPDDRLKRISFN